MEPLRTKNPSKKRKNKKQTGKNANPKLTAELWTGRLCSFYNDFLHVKDVPRFGDKCLYQELVLV